MRALPHPFTLAFFALCFTVLVLSGNATLSDPDTLWHLAAGDLVRATHALPHTDPWSYTAGETRWYLLSWAWDTAASWIYQHAGARGLVMASAAVYSAAFATLFAHARTRGADAIAAFFTVMLFATAIHALVRPHAVSLLLAVVFHAAATLHARGSHRWLLWVLPVLMVAWVNMHGGFVVGLSVLGAYALHAWQQRRMHDVRALVAVGSLCTLACLVNPYAWHVLEGMARSLGGHFNPVIAEWQPFRFTFVPFLLLLVVLAPPRDARFPLAERVLAYAWLWMGLMNIRHLMLAMALATPMLAVALHQALQPKTPREGWAPLMRWIATWSRPEKQVVLRALSAVALAGYVAWLPVPAPAPLVKLEEEIAYLRTHHHGERFLIHYNLGSQFVYATRGDVPVFVDSRADTVYPPDVADAYVAFEQGTEGWDAVFTRYHIRGVVLPTAPENRTLVARFEHKAGWHKALETPYSVIFVRD